MDGEDGVDGEGGVQHREAGAAQRGAEDAPRCGRSVSTDTEPYYCPDMPSASPPHPSAHAATHPKLLLAQSIAHILVSIFSPSQSQFNSLTHTHTHMIIVHVVATTTLVFDHKITNEDARLE